MADMVGCEKFMNMCVQMFFELTYSTFISQGVQVDKDKFLEICFFLSYGLTGVVQRCYRQEKEYDYEVQFKTSFRALFAQTGLSQQSEVYIEKALQAFAEADISALLDKLQLAKIE